MLTLVSVHAPLPLPDEADVAAVADADSTADDQDVDDVPEADVPAEVAEALSL